MHCGLMLHQANKRFLLGLILALLATATFAQPPRYGLIMPTMSKHYGGNGIPCNASETGKTKHREVNLGVGAQLVFDREWAIELGYYNNSAWNKTVYTLTKWTPLDYGWVRFGLGAGLATGYCTKPVLPMVGFVSSFDITEDVGFDVVATPPLRGTDGVIGVQLRLTFW